MLTQLHVPTKPTNNTFPRYWISCPAVLVSDLGICFESMCTYTASNGENILPPVSILARFRRILYNVMIAYGCPRLGPWLIPYLCDQRGRVYIRIPVNGGAKSSCWQLAQLAHGRKKKWPWSRDRGSINIFNTPSAMTMRRGCLEENSRQKLSLLRTTYIQALSRRHSFGVCPDVGSQTGKVRGV